MNPTEVYNLAHLLMRKWFGARHGWRFGWNEERTAYGACFPRLRRIELSRPLAALCSRQEVEHVLLHEIAHGLAHIHDGDHAHGHGPQWRRWAVRVGARPEAAWKTGPALPPAWEGTCPKCGWKVVVERDAPPATGSLCRCIPCAGQGQDTGPALEYQPVQ